MERPAINLKLRLPRARWVAIGAVAALITVAYAAVPQTFSAGEPLSASALNENFAALDQRGGGYCGATAPVQPRLDPTNGYLGGAMLCAKAMGCGPTARICTPQDMVQYASTGQKSPPGWIATGIVSFPAGSTIDDCGGFTSNTSEGTEWNGTGAQTRL
jgi:hypothetical protein